MTEWWQDLQALHAAVWARLEDGVARPGAPARQLALATAGRTGGAEARMVILRAAERAPAQLVVHTDTLSAKVAELRADPRCTLLLWDPAARLQVRLKAEAGIDTGAVVHADWSRIPPPARRVYGNAPPPGAPMPAPASLTTRPDPDRFAVITFTLSEIDALRLGDDIHHRARFRRHDGWAGSWTAP